jgi:hypothetical protein
LEEALDLSFDRLLMMMMMMDLSFDRSLLLLMMMMIVICVLRTPGSL